MAESPGKQSSEKKQLTASGAEVVFLVLLVAFGLGVCVLAERVFTWSWQAPTEQQFAGASSIKEKQERLARLQSAIKEAEKQLDVVTLEQLKHTAALESLKKSYPYLANPAQAQGTPISNTGNVQQNYETAKMQQLAAGEYAALLNARVASLQEEADETAKALEPQKQAAAKDFKWRTRVYRGIKFLVSFVVPMVVVLPVWFIGGFALKRIAKNPIWINHGWLPFFLILGALLILLAYRAFEIAGAVLIGMFVFFILLRRIKWTPGVGERE